MCMYFIHRSGSRALLPALARQSSKAPVGARSQRPKFQSPETVVQDPTVLLPEFDVEELDKNLKSQSTSKQQAKRLSGPVDSKELVRLLLFL